MGNDVLTAMLAPAFFLTATASLLLSVNNRLARIIDRARSLIVARNSAQGEHERQAIERHIECQRKRSMLVLRAGQLLYVAIALFVCTSLAVAIDNFISREPSYVPVVLATTGALAMLAASVLLARESLLAVTAINDEMAHDRKP